MVKNQSFGQKSKFWSKIKVLVKNQSFGQKSKFWSKIEIWIKNRGFGQKLIVWSKLEVLVKNRSFDQKSKFSSKIEIVGQKSKISIEISNKISIILLRFFLRNGKYIFVVYFTTQALGGIASGVKASISFPELYRQEPGKLTDADLFRFLAELGKPGKYLEKLETIFRHPSSPILQISIEQTKETGLVDVLTSSLYPVKPYHASSRAPYFEIDSFEEIAPNLARPFSSYVNHLYVRPHLLRYDAQKNFPKARNIAISCELWDGDELGKSRRVCCLYTRPETRGLIFDTSRHTAVTHHQTNPQFYEEIKIELPPNIHDGHHVKFVIYHVAVDPKKAPYFNSNEQSRKRYIYFYIVLYLFF